jgi:GPI-anchor transamidase subunit T
MNWRSYYCPVLALLLFLNPLPCSKIEEYTETASITYLPSHNILLDINFKLSHEFTSSFESQSPDLDLFPSLIYSLPTEFGLQEGKIAFTRGIWDSSLWSKAPNRPTSSGFQFHGHFKENYQDLAYTVQIFSFSLLFTFIFFSIENRFNKAIEIISGYFCASLNVLKYSSAIKPTIPSFQSKSAAADPLVTIAGIIPSEPVCIENLQPWLDLLPCSISAGLAQMFKPEAIYQSDFHSIEVEFLANFEKTTIEMNLRMITVYDLNKWDRNRNWSLTSLLGKPFIKICPFVTNEPKVILRIPNTPAQLSSLLQQKDFISSQEDHLLIEYQGSDLLSEIGATEIAKFNNPIDRANGFRSYRYKSGSRDDFGGIGLLLQNDLLTPLEITVIESIPWLFRVFLHQGQFSLNSKLIEPSQLSKYLKEFLIETSINRKRSLLIQSKWMIPPKSRIQIYFPFEREFLRIDEFPPNSERGIELPGALIFYKSSDILLHTETTNTLLFTWPIPDGTMPFNVITMTSTLVALFYGSFFNLIFRRYYLKHPEDPPPGILPKIVWRLKTSLLNKK